MTETRPVYHADIAGLATERRRAMTDAALTDAGAAMAGRRADATIVSNGVTDHDNND